MAVVRVSASEISACGGTLNDFIGGQLEALRTEPMDVKERAAAVLHPLDPVVVAGFAEGGHVAAAIAAAVVWAVPTWAVHAGSVLLNCSSICRGLESLPSSRRSGLRMRARWTLSCGYLCVLRRAGGA